jgi:YHS domain-containing protein
VGPAGPRMDAGQAGGAKPCGDGAGCGSATDVVCGMTVDPATGVNAGYAGRVHYFCGEGCARHFAADPLGRPRRRAVHLLRSRMPRRIRRRRGRAGRQVNRPARCRPVPRPFEVLAVRRRGPDFPNECAGPSPPMSSRCLGEAVGAARYSLGLSRSWETGIRPGVGSAPELERSACRSSRRPRVKERLPE